ncbi:hypothetical protein WJU16_02950 [Chitinophaga pollutisoli]|uniref:Uncharacterized protein n=1 Tax=Chitinophaga pollutisoli TaxID=3133966 RepID=A0ABZ2YRA3_9BACT
MFNEAIHLDGIKGIDGVIFMRFTASPNVYYQQMGRCFSVNQTQQPIIFDLVNNFSSVSRNKFKKEVEAEFQTDSHDLPWITTDLRFGRASSNKELIGISFFDETREIRELFNSFASEFDNWEIQFKNLSALIQQGQSISHRYTPSAYQFVNRNKYYYRKGLLSTERVQKLLNIGINFTPKPYGQNWNLIKSGADWRIAKSKLNSWVYSQIIKYRQGKLTNEQIAILTNAGVRFDKPACTFDQNLEKFIAYRADLINNPLSDDLRSWIRSQKLSLRRKTLTPDHKSKLDAIGFGQFTENDRQWEISFQKYTNGCIDRSLQNWILKQKKYYDEGILAEWKIIKLKSIGFDFTQTKIASWNEMFEEVKENKDWKKVKKLRLWVTDQARRFRKGELSPEKTSLLNAIGIIFSKTAYRSPYAHKDFNQMIQEYKAFLSDLSEPDMTPELGLWVRNQRSRYRKGKVSNAEKRALDAVGIMNKPVNERGWLARLERYKSGERSREINVWAKLQRKTYRMGRLSEDRMRQLRSIKFKFDAAVEHV